MPKMKLQLGAELETLSARELGAELDKHASWERQAAFGLRHQDLPRMIGTTDGVAGNLQLGADQPDQPTCGPKAGWYWAVSRISVDGLAAGESVKIYKETKFVGWVSQLPGFLAFGTRGLVLKPGDFLRLVAAGLTVNEELTLSGECVSVPAELMWKILS
jgi:hypothetical protein